jgi:hypothetical protein
VSIVWSSTCDSLADFDSASAGITVTTGGLRPNRLAVADGSGVSEVRKGVGELTEYAVRGYVTLGARSSAFVECVNAADSTLCRVDFNSAGNVRLLPAGSGVAWASDALLPLNTPIRFEVVVDAAGNGTLSLYDGDSSQLLQGGGGVVGAGTLATVAFGRTTNGSTSTGMFLDDLAVSDTAALIGPAGGSGPPPAGTPVVFRLDAGGVLTPYEITAL